MSESQPNSSWSIIESIGSIVYVVEQQELSKLKIADSAELFVCRAYEVLGSGRFIKFHDTYTMGYKPSDFLLMLREVVLDTDRYTISIRGYDLADFITKVESRGEF